MQILRSYRDPLILLLVWAIATLIVYLPFLTSPLKLQLIYQNWDGPNYVVIGKSLYNPQIIKEFNFLGGWMTPIMFASNFPLYAIFIKILSFIGYFRAMLGISLLFSILSIWLFYHFIKKFKLTTQPLFLSLVFIFLPPRWFSVYHTGNSDPQFVFFTLLTLYFFYADKLLLSGISGGLAQLSRFQGIVYFPIFIFLLFKKKYMGQFLRKSLNYLIIPVSLLLVFLLYLYQYGDFFAFFHSRPTVGLLKWPPFAVFNWRAPWVGTIWLEEIIFLFIIEMVAIANLFRMGNKYRPLAYFSLFCFIPSLFVVQQDISRYSLWLAPATLIGLKDIIERKEFKLILLVIIPAVIAYSTNFFQLNLAP
ncbi:hypothetical protein HY407_00945 [Candidatus Gottesmanbacteria bacterium]|nr:hypothetical protein [Candidatus Gottesmanbacteria bacterium]